MTVAQLPDDHAPTVSRQSGDRIAIHVEDPDDSYGLLLSADAAVATAEEILAVAGEIGGVRPVTIWAEEVSLGEAAFAGERHVGIEFADRDSRRVRIAFREDALRKLGNQIAELLRPRDIGQPH